MVTGSQNWHKLFKTPQLENVLLGVKSPVYLDVLHLDRTKQGIKLPLK